MTSALYKRYVFSTIAYGAVGAATLVLAIASLIAQRWLLLAIFVVMTGVCIDNFFCGDRCRVAGGKAKGEYTIPPFLRKQ